MLCINPEVNFVALIFELEVNWAPFLVQQSNNSKWSTLLIRPDVGNFQHPEVLDPSKSLEFPIRSGESGQMRLRLNYWNGFLPSLACDAPPKAQRVATSAPFAVE